jgi:hypothetical protein
MTFRPCRPGEGPKGTGPLPFGADGPGRTNVLSLAGSVLPAGVALPLTVFLAEMCVVTLSRPAHRPGHGRPCRRRESCATIGLTCRAGQGRASKGQDQERKGSRGNAQHPRPPVLRGRTGPGGNGREGVRIRHIGGDGPDRGVCLGPVLPTGTGTEGRLFRKKLPLSGCFAAERGRRPDSPPSGMGLADERRNPESTQEPRLASAGGEAPWHNNMRRAVRCCGGSSCGTWPWSAGLRAAGVAHNGGRLEQPTFSPPG